MPALPGFAPPLGAGNVERSAPLRSSAKFSPLSMAIPASDRFATTSNAARTSSRGPMRGAPSRAGGSLTNVHNVSIT